MSRVGTDYRGMSQIEQYARAGPTRLYGYCYRHEVFVAWVPTFKSRPGRYIPKRASEGASLGGLAAGDSPFTHWLSRLTASNSPDPQFFISRSMFWRSLRSQGWPFMRACSWRVKWSHRFSPSR